MNASSRVRQTRRQPNLHHRAASGLYPDVSDPVKLLARTPLSSYRDPVARPPILEVDPGHGSEGVASVQSIQ